MANVIVNRVSEFLKRYPPFSFLSEEDLEQVASEVQVSYFAKDELLFRQGQPAEAHFFVLKEGSIVLLEEKGERSEIKEVCDEGDVFGVLALLGERPYVLSARSDEESLVYCIPVSTFREILDRNGKVAMYFAAGFAAGQVVVRASTVPAGKPKAMFRNESRDHSLLIFSDESQVKYSKEVLTCPVELSIRDAAQQMTEKQVSSIVIVDDEKFPLGIVTDKDLRAKVLARGFSSQEKIARIMSSPVLTRKPESDFSELYLTMIKNRLHHLILTEDGTPQSPVKGILSDHDVLLSMGNSPAVLIHGLMNTFDPKEMHGIRDRAEDMLRYYLENEVAMDFVASVMTEVNDVIIRQAVSKAKQDLAKDFPGFDQLKFCFLSLGSEGREEQLLRTDQDNAIVYQDVSEAQKEQAQEYFLKLGTAIVEVLLTCGFASCPGNIMASNPEWVQPLSQWKKYFSDWILTPTNKALTSASIFFDFRRIVGSAELEEQMSQHIHEEIQKKQVFLSFLAKNALMNPPPLGFFKGFMVEKSGEHKNQFDIKARAMMPLADLARLLVLSHGLVGVNNTFKRFEKLAELEPKNASLYQEAGEAYEILMRMRALEGLKNKSSGRFIQPDSLGKLQRQLLKSTFSPISDLQELAEVRFQVDYLGR
ncbi:DUF294 nucleotidyltransferase-like domain-containing protein [Algoriphagus namhaensis]|uniref:DUF294 nucleotidyltransferase-like domain-containing protein n=1 Tax=Algoriphagus namhaensis TaxID=915353 RepID=A0ABV8ANG3_9BACT